MWLIAHPNRWPKQLMLSANTEFPAVANGKVVGRVQVSAGSAVDLVSITPADIVVAFRGAQQKISHSITDLSDLAAVEMNKPEASSPVPAASSTPLATPLPASTPRPLRDQLGAVIQRDKSGNAKGTCFRVWAPHAKSLDVVGSFNHWKSGADKMVKDEASGIWTKDVSDAKPGDQYMFLVNGDKERRDPRARQISADGKCVLYDSNHFDWGNKGEWKSSALLGDLVIYQLHPGTFYDPDPADGDPGTLLDAIGKLDHLQDLGINCVLLMPVNEFPGRHSWGYNPSDLFAVETAYGGPDALKSFVKAAHERGIAVHVDVVHNHYGPEGLDLWQFDVYGGGDTKAGIYFYEDGERGSTAWGPRPDFGRREVRDFIADQIRMWFEEYKIDGLRWDSTVNIRRCAEGAIDNPEGDKLLDELSRMIRREYPGKVSIAEDSVGDERFDASWEYDFHHAGDDRKLGVVPQLVRADGLPDAADLASRIQSPLGMRRVIYTENHDETGRLNGHQRLLVDADQSDPQSLAARRKAALGAVLTLTSPGVPLIFMGQEMLEDNEFHDSNALDWKRGLRAAQTFQLWRDLVHLRRNLEGRGASLADTRVGVLEADKRKGLLAYQRSIPGRTDEDLVVVLNLLPDPMEKVPVWFPHAGEWRMVFNTDDLRYGSDFSGVATTNTRTDTSQKLSLHMAPYSAQIFALSKAYPPRDAAEQSSQAAEALAEATPEPVAAMSDNTGEMQLDSSEPADRPPSDGDYLVPSEPAHEDAATNP